jgi:hypothetical protein
VAALIKRHRQSDESFEEADDYYNRLSETISTQEISRWNEEITFAEVDRQKNPAAMDIMASRLSHLDPNESQANESTSDSPGIAWIAMGLSIEERQ